MDSLLGSTESYLSNSANSIQYTENYKYQSDSLVIEKTLSNNDTVNINFQDSQKGIIITAQEILKKLNELLKDKLPDGIESLNPDDYTSDATSTRIVQGITGLYGMYKDQHPELSDEELLNKFMEEAKKGVQSGYDDAFKTLDGLGAFQLDGVQKGVEQTKILIDQKLDAFYQAKRKELGLDEQDVSNSVKESVSSNLVTQAGVKSLSVSA